MIRSIYFVKSWEVKVVDSSSRSSFDSDIPNPTSLWSRSYTAILQVHRQLEKRVGDCSGLNRVLKDSSAEVLPLHTSGCGLVWKQDGSRCN